MKNGSQKPTAFSTFEKAYKKHVPILVRTLDKVAELNGGKGKTYLAANSALEQFSKSFKKMGQGEK